VRTRVVANVTAANGQDALRDCASPSACIVTDELNVYPKATQGYAAHKAVNHGAGEYARYEEDGFEVSTNRAEGFFSLVRRSLTGIYHAVSREHLHRYITEREFLYNTRGMDDGERVALSIRQSERKRFTYRFPG
jgi:transposase-like protein